MRKLAVFPALIFGLFWCSLVAFFDYVSVGQVLNQWRSSYFEQTTGTITHSEVTQHRGSKGGPTYGADIKYTYSVGEQTYSGERYRYDAWASSDSEWAYKAVGQHPIGATVKVYYDPKKPSEAVLSTGVNGGSLFMLIFLTPFNLIGIALLRVPVTALFAWIRRDPADVGVPIFHEGSKTRIRLQSLSPFSAAMLWFGVASFISIFIIAFAFGFHARTEIVATVWIINLSLGVVGWTLRKRKIASGKEDLVIDEGEMIANLPLTHGRKEPEQVALKDIFGVVMFIVTERNRKGSTSRRYDIHFEHGKRLSKVTEFYREREGERFGKWLAERLGRPFRVDNV